MNVYLFSDIFNNFQKFFCIDRGVQAEDSNFLYDISFGFIPRKFENTAEDKIIYDEEDNVPEMYFLHEGTVGVGFSLVQNGMNLPRQYISKKLHTNA